MLRALWSSIGWKEEQVPSRPPAIPVIITGVRIPADGTPAHLLPLTTIEDPSTGTDGFLVHVPDVRAYWASPDAWRRRDIHRLDLQKDHNVPLSHHARLKKDVRKLLLPTLHRLNQEEMFRLRQRNFHDQRYWVLQPQYQSSCAGAYYVFYPFDVDGLPENEHVPAWVREVKTGHYVGFWGDLFIVRLGPREHEADGRAIYADVDAQFLELLAEGPLDSRANDIPDAFF